MAKKKTKKHTRHAYRNAAPRPAPPHYVTARAPRAGKDPETALQRLGYTAAGAAGTALVGSFLSREGWAPKTIATALAAVGAGLAWKGDESTIRSVGAGTMSAAGSQLALMLMDDREHKAGTATAPGSGATTAAKKHANAGELPPGTLESAYARAKARLVLAASESEMAA